MFLHDAVGYGQPQSRTLSGPLRGVEGVEDLVDLPFRNPNTRIFDFDADTIGGHTGRARRTVGGIRPQMQRSAVRHRVKRVQGQIKKDLLKVVTVSGHVG